jgi:hypothetical protein
LPKLDFMLALVRFMRCRLGTTTKGKALSD